MHRGVVMQVAVIGAGYVGLVQAVGLASLGHDVAVGEADPVRRVALEQSRSPIYEPGLQDLLERVIQAGTLSIHADNRAAVAGCHVVFLAVPTPLSEDGTANLSAVDAVLDEIGPVLEEGVVVAFKSTVPVGTVAATQRRLGPRVHVASNPEFLQEGNAVAGFFHPDRIVVGASDDRAALLLTDLYDGIDAPIVLTDPVAAELAKYAANAYLATRVTFANSIANVCEAVGADVHEVLHGMGYDRRIGHHFMRPGPGYGGSCFPKDTAALVSVAGEAGYDFSLLKAVIAENDAQRRRILHKVERAVGGDLSGSRVAVWGATFKAGTDDLRDSPALWLIRQLMAHGAVPVVFDPLVVVDGVENAPDPLAAAHGADAVLLGTEWTDFAKVDLVQLAEVMAGRHVIDARNLLDPEQVRAAGLVYTGVGRQ